MTPEKFWLAAARLPDGEQPHALAAPEGDGSPMEEGARVAWVGLDEAIARCVRGEIEDAKTELVLRRLRDRLAEAPPRP
jgi:ADP-ribose pyrophosphatase